MYSMEGVDDDATDVEKEIDDDASGGSNDSVNDDASDDASDDWTDASNVAESDNDSGVEGRIISHNS